jgi:hypothetical protein
MSVPKPGRAALAIAATLCLGGAALPALATSDETSASGFTVGKVRLTPGTGGGFLPINVPAAGVVTMVEAHPKAAAPGVRVKQYLLRTSERRPATAKQVQLALTPTSRGFALLEAKGSLRTRVRVTYTPTDAGPTSQVIAVELKLTRAAR